MARVLRNDVHLETSPGVTVVLKAGTSVPPEYANRVTNPSAYVETAAAEPSAPAAAAPAAPATAQGSTPEKVDYTKLSKKEITALAGTRGIEVKKSDTIAKIAEALAAQDAEEEAAQQRGADDVALDEMSEEQLRAYASEHEIDISEAQTVEEILALVENAQE